MVEPELDVTVVFNGCIYNHRELRRELKTAGYRFVSTRTATSCSSGTMSGGAKLVDPWWGCSRSAPSSGTADEPFWLATSSA
jgi:asparagine synthase (glutamine-hydrolysing)